MRKFDDALKALDRAAKHAPKSAHVFRMRAQLNEAMGNPAAAQKDRQRADALAGQTPTKQDTPQSGPK